MILSVQNLNLAYAKHTVLHHFSFELQTGEIACLLGHSGCGKTTALRAIAGFERAQSGRIILKNQILADEKQFIAPHLRKIGMVFQDYALFPHLNVFDNIAFGINKQSDKAKRVQELLQLIGLSPYQRHFPHQLSGGQQQRVALARALAPKPDLILLDEPFSNLDTDLRTHLSKEVRHLLKSQNTSAIMVTHDQQEAFAIADKIGVMFAGHLHQWANPSEIYHHPQTAEVAQFIGTGILLNAQACAPNRLNSHAGTIEIAHDFSTGTKLRVLVRPDHIHINTHAPAVAQIGDKDFKGDCFIYTLELDNGETLLARSSDNYELGQKVGVQFALKQLTTFPHPH